MKSAIAIAVLGLLMIAAAGTLEIIYPRNNIERCK